MSAATAVEDPKAGPGAAPAPASAGRLRARPVPVWAVPAVVTAVVCLIRIGHPVLWRDEIATLSAATRSFGDQIRLEREIDAVLGGYYALMRVWTTVFGTSEAALRLPSVLAMAVAAGAVAAIGARLFDRRAGLLAGLVFAVLPAVSRFGQEARPYAGVLAAATLSTLLLLRAAQGRRWTGWVAYGASILVVGVGNILALTVLLAHAAYVGYTAWSHHGRPRWTWLRRGPVPGWLIAAVLPVAVLAPLALLAGRQRSQVDWIPALTVSAAGRWHDDLFLDASVGAAVIVLALLAVRGSVPATVLCGALAVLPLLALAAASLTVAPLWILRYALFTVPGWVILAGAALAGLRRPEAAAALSAVVLFSLPSHWAIRDANGHDEIDYRGLAAILATNGAPGDAAFYPRIGRIREGVTYYLAEDLRPVDVLATGTAAEAASLEVPECEQPKACLGRTVRIWVFCVGDCRDDPLSDLSGPKQDVVSDGGFRLQRTWRVYRATAAVYQR